MSETNVRDVEGWNGRPAPVRAVIGGLGVVALVAGARAVLLGAKELPEVSAVAPSIDSEYRFYASWYPVIGLALLRVARDQSVDDVVVPGICGGLLIAAAARTRSLRTVGRPHRSQLALMAIEYALPALLLPWHRRSMPHGAS